MNYKFVRKFWAAMAVMGVYLIAKSISIYEQVNHVTTVRLESVTLREVPSYSGTMVEVACFVAFIPIFWGIYCDLRLQNKEAKSTRDYYAKLNSMIVEQSNNDVFYDGDTMNGSKALVRGISKSLDADRVSIWLYNTNRTEIVLQDLYRKLQEDFITDATLAKKNYGHYFRALLNDPIIVADDALTHKATSCFKENYLKPLGIKSMLDVPIWHNDNVIGVICIESFTKREWKKEEIDFAKIMSSFYSFAHSVKENFSLFKNHQEIEKFIDAATLVSKTDKAGKITYANRKFEQVSGWKLKEMIGKDHKILTSSEHTAEFWEKMYSVANAGKIWNGIITNRTKSGSVFYVDTYVKADTNPETGEVTGYTSIRQDITAIMKFAKEIEKKNTYLEHAAKILRHDMHSGINTYIPRGVSSLERRLSPEIIEQNKLEAPLKMIKEGLKHTQRVYRGVYEFTNLVKPEASLEKSSHDLSKILEEYLSSTAYKQQVIIDSLGEAKVNEPLFCTAIDNLIRNGLKYNDNDNKLVKIYRDEDTIYVEDNGRGLSAEDFKKYSQPYARKKEQKESGTGLGLNICIAILEEHRFQIACDKIPTGGTQFKIKLNNNAN